MALITSQQLKAYYDQHRERSVSFNRQVIQVLKLIPREVYLKCHGSRFPCVIYSSSMSSAKVIANLRAQALQKLRLANNQVALRFAFERSDKPAPLLFFIPAKVLSFSYYNPAKPELYFLTLEYTSKPPDDLIEKLGQLFEANINARRRKEERIDMNPSVIKSLGMDGKEASLVIDQEATRCIVRDLSFSGAKILLYGAGKEQVGRIVVLHLSFSGMEKPIMLPGTVVRFEEVVGREDIGAFGIHFLEEKIPMSYKILLNGYFRTYRHTAPEPGS